MHNISALAHNNRRAALTGASSNAYKVVRLLQVRKYHVDNIQDSNDIKLIRSEIQSLDGVHTVRVDNVSNTITVEFEDNVNERRIQDTINKHRHLH